MPARTPAFILLLIVAFPSSAPALGFEYLGNARVESQGGWSTAFMNAVNNSKRVDGYDVNGNPTFFFHGDANDLNEAIVQFAAIPAEHREIVLLPGRGEVRTFDRKTEIVYGWSLNVPMGLHLLMDEKSGEARTTMTIRIPSVRVIPLKETASFKGLLADLESPEFKVRDRASKKLSELGAAAAPLFRKALATTTSAEVRARLELLLAPHRGIQLDLLAIPADIPVVGVDELLERSLRNLDHKSRDVRNNAVHKLAQPGFTPADVVPALGKLVKSEADESVLSSAAGALTALGAGAKPAVAILRAKAAGQSEHLKKALEEAADAIEKLEVQLPSETDKALADIRLEIGKFVKARGGEKGKR